MSDYNIITPNRVDYRRARVLIGLPLNGATTWDFEGNMGTHPQTGEYIHYSNTTYVPDMIYTPEDMQVHTHYIEGIKMLVERFQLHENIEICVVPYATSANMTDEAHDLYGENYTFLSGNSIPDVVSFVENTKAVGAHNLGDFYRRAFHLLDAQKTNHKLYYISLVPSTATHCSFTPFLPDAKVELATTFEFLSDNSEVQGISSRVLNYYDNKTGLFDWEKWLGFYNSLSETYKEHLFTCNFGGTGSGLSNGIVDEHSLGYAVLGAERLQKTKAKGYHIVNSEVAPPMLTDALKDTFGIRPEDIGRSWLQSDSPETFYQAINAVANSIIEDTKVKDSDYQYLFDTCLK